MQNDQSDISHANQRLCLSGGRPRLHPLELIHNPDFNQFDPESGIFSDVGLKPQRWNCQFLQKNCASFNIKWQHKSRQLNRKRWYKLRVSHCLKKNYRKFSIISRRGRHSVSQNTEVADFSYPQKILGFLPIIFPPSFIHSLQQQQNHPLHDRLLRNLSFSYTGSDCSTPFPRPILHWSHIWHSESHTKSIYQIAALNRLWNTEQTQRRHRHCRPYCYHQRIRNILQFDSHSRQLPLLNHFNWGAVGHCSFGCIFGSRSLGCLLFEPVHHAFEERGVPTLAGDEIWHFSGSDGRWKDIRIWQIAASLVADIWVQDNGSFDIELLHLFGIHPHAVPFITFYSSERVPRKRIHNKIRSADDMSQPRQRYAHALLRLGSTRTVPRVVLESSQRSQIVICWIVLCLY